MKFVDCFLDNIPKEIFPLFPSLKSLDISGTSLARLEYYDFMFNRLTVINASFNHLNRIGPKMVLQSENLESLDLSHNLISRINPDAFRYNENFKYLNLSHNNIGKLDIYFFQPLRSLLVLHVDNNQIKEISGNFTNFKMNLKEFYLQNNMLKTLDPSLVRTVSILDVSRNKIKEAKFHFSSLIELSISENSLTVLTIGENLKKLDASGNHETSFLFDFKKNKILKHLDLSSAQLKSKKDTFASILTLNQLTYLDLSHVDVELKDKMFEKLPELETLKLSKLDRDRLEFPKKIFINLNKLKFLDFSFNAMEYLELKELDALKSLETLIVDHCRIQELRSWRNVSTFLPKLKEINFYGNLLDCFEIQQIVRTFMRKGIKIIDLDGEGKEDFIHHSCDELRHNDHDVKIDAKIAEKDYDARTTSHTLIWWLVGCFIVCCAIGVAVVAYQKLSFFKKWKGLQYRTEGFSDAE